MCHGANGKGGPSAALVGNPALTGGERYPVKTIANYWPLRHNPLRLYSAHDAVAATALAH